MSSLLYSQVFLRPAFCLIPMLLLLIVFQNRVSLSKSLASLFQDKSCVVDPARLDLPINVAAVCALDDQGVPVAVEEEEVESDSRPSPDSRKLCIGIDSIEPVR